MSTRMSSATSIARHRRDVRTGTRQRDQSGFRCERSTCRHGRPIARSWRLSAINCIHEKHTSRVSEQPVMCFRMLPPIRSMLQSSCPVRRLKRGQRACVERRRPCFSSLFSIGSSPEAIFQLPFQSHRALDLCECGESRKVHAHRGSGNPYTTTAAISRDMKSKNMFCAVPP
jgi:hypothetical protein